MKTFLKTTVLALTLVGATAVLTAQAVSDKHEEQMQDMEKMMEAWMKYAMPGKEHAEMVKSAGKWKQETTHWMAPGVPPTTSTGTATLNPILGGRFMMEKSEGTMNINGQDMAFEGLGIFGFDNIKQKHTFVWADNMGTLFMIGEGTADATGKEITYYSELPDPMTGGTMEIKTVSRILHDNKHEMEMFSKLPDGSWFQNMKIKATRGY